MAYGRSILADLQLAEEAEMVFPKAEVVLEEEVTAENEGLEALIVAELRDKGRVLCVVPAGTDREKRRPEPWVTALRVARAAVQPAAAAAAAAAAGVAAAAVVLRQSVLKPLSRRCTRLSVHDHMCARSTQPTTTAVSVASGWTAVTQCR
jgi:hypothetical protein